MPCSCSDARRGDRRVRHLEYAIAGAAFPYWFQFPGAARADFLSTLKRIAETVKAGMQCGEAVNVVAGPIAASAAATICAALVASGYDPIGAAERIGQRLSEVL